MNNQLRVIVAGELDRQRWNNFIDQAPTFGLLQSYEWGETKEKLGWRVIRLAVERDSKIAAAAQIFIKEAPLGLFSIAYVPRGPVVDWEDRPLTNTLLEAIHCHVRPYRAIFLRIEPPLPNSRKHNCLLESYGFRGVKHTNQPRCSMVVDLPDDMNDLLMSLPSPTRYNIRLSQRKGVAIKIGEVKDVVTLHNLLASTADRKGFPVRSLEYYLNEWQTFVPTGQARLFLAQYKGKTITAQMPFYFGRHCATFHAGSLGKYRKLKAGYLTMWEAMCWAHEQGCRTFDLWGIPDEIGSYMERDQEIPKGKSGGLWGVYYFKRAFRGDIVYYVSAHDYPYFSLPYRTIETATSQLETLDVLARLWN